METAVDAWEQDKTDHNSSLTEQHRQAEGQAVS